MGNWCFFQQTGVRKDDDPRPVIIDAINEAYADMGGHEMLFNLSRGAILSAKMGKLEVTTWETLCESMNQIHEPQSHLEQVCHYH